MNPTLTVLRLTRRLHAFANHKSPIFVRRAPIGFLTHRAGVASLHLSQSLLRAPLILPWIYLLVLHHSLGKGARRFFLYRAPVIRAPVPPYRLGSSGGIKTVRFDPAFPAL